MTDATIFSIGIDVGGTFIKAGLVSPDGAVVAKDESASEADRGPDHMIVRMAAAANRLRTIAPKGATIVGVGLGMPGTLSHRDGIVFMPPNLPGWKNVPVAALLRERTGLSVSLENDANCAAVAEFTCGAGRGRQHLVLLTLGTGVGGGIVLNGKLWRGADECAAEVGHTLVQMNGRRCGCGQLGCLEAYASASSTAMRAEEAIKAGRPSSLLAELRAKGRLSSLDVVNAAGAGDALANEIWTETCRYLAIACLNLHHTVNPELIVLAGGMCAAGERLLSPVMNAVHEFGSRMINKSPTICLAELGNDAGFVGAGLTVFENARV